MKVMKVALLILLAACQGSSTTPFPPGLEPFEPDHRPAAHRLRRVETRS